MARVTPGSPPSGGAGGGGGSDTIARGHLAASTGTTAGGLTIPWTETFDDATANIIDAGQPTRLEVPAGKTRVRISGFVAVGESASPVGIREVTVSRNGAAQVGYSAIQPNGVNTSVPFNTGWLAVVADTDYYTVRLTQNSGSSLSVLGGDSVTHVTAEFR